MIRRRLLHAAIAVAATAPILRADCDITAAQAAIASCDAAFPGDFFLVVSARGWCYIMSGAACVLA